MSGDEEGNHPERLLFAMVCRLYWPFSTVHGHYEEKYRFSGNIYELDYAIKAIFFVLGIYLSIVLVQRSVFKINVPLLLITALLIVFSLFAYKLFPASAIAGNAAALAAGLLLLQSFIRKK
ncbi:hypothetical protein [Paenibacillus sp. NPDC058071]|uniref:hypothetical protein n=1 Tax=Paenibacillus sp. NPDC058071 TaxID=3346326 RepID=UPI0036D77C93